MDTNGLVTAVEKATTVAAEAAQAAATLLDAETEALEALVTLVPAALVRAAGSRPIVCDSAGVQIRADWRGISLYYPTFGPERRKHSTNATRGDVAGRDIFLCDDGVIRQLTYGGEWSSWANEHDEWSATEEQLTAREACSKWKELATNALERFTEELGAYADGNASKHAAKARARAEMLRALSVLLANR